MADMGQEDVGMSVWFYIFTWTIMGIGFFLAMGILIWAIFFHGR